MDELDRRIQESKRVKEAFYNSGRNTQLVATEEILDIYSSILIKYSPNSEQIFEIFTRLQSCANTGLYRATDVNKQVNALCERHFPKPRLSAINHPPVNDDCHKPKKCKKNHKKNRKSKSSIREQ